MSLGSIKKDIATSLKRARLERRVTQRELATTLGMTQARLSQIENGKGSLSAEQLITVLKHFNLPLNYFVRETKKEAPEDKLQNALNAMGATELYTIPDTLQSEQLIKLENLITETLTMAYSSRTITALAPVIIEHVESINFQHIQNSMHQIGLLGRLGWTLENTVNALISEQSPSLPRTKTLLYRRCLVKINLALNNIKPSWNTIYQHLPTEDLLDKNISSEKTLQETKNMSDELARKWKIITTITVNDFIQAIRGAQSD